MCEAGGGEGRKRGERGTVQFDVPAEEGALNSSAILSPSL